MVGLYAGFTAPAAVEQPQRPFPNLSWLANWTMVIEGDPVGAQSQDCAFDGRSFQVLSKYSLGPTDGTIAIIDDFLGNDGEWPFVSHCLAYEYLTPTSASACFVGVARVDGS
eukprot:gene18968-33662_t